MKNRHADSFAYRFGLLAGLALFACPGAALAQSAPADTGQIIRLSPEQREDVLNSGSEQTVDAARGRLLGGGGGGREIHGEFGAMIGTGGARGVYGTAAIPLGDHAGAVISFENSRYGRPY